MRVGFVRGVIAVGLTLAGAAAAADTVSGAGSSAAAPIYHSWGEAYERATGAKLDYASIGSSAGLGKIRAREVGFGASDVAPSRAELDKDGLVVFPIAITGIVPVVNLPRLGANQLRLNGTVLARIFRGEVTQWSAPEIAQLNPGMALPSLPVKVVVRNDGSGTTYNFTDYLAKVDPQWQARFGVKTRIDWPEQFLTAKGSEGVARLVASTAGAISYVDFNYVQEFQLVPVQLSNQAGTFLSASSDTFRAALGASPWISSGNFTTTLTNQPGGLAWPVTMATFALVPQVSTKPQETVQALKFFAWAFVHGDELVQKSSFVRLPTRVQAAAFKAIASVKDAQGNLIGLPLASF